MEDAISSGLKEPPRVYSFDSLLLGDLPDLSSDLLDLLLSSSLPILNNFISLDLGFGSLSFSLFRSKSDSEFTKSLDFSASSLSDDEDDVYDMSSIYEKDLMSILYRTFVGTLLAFNF